MEVGEMMYPEELMVQVLMSEGNLPPEQAVHLAHRLISVMQEYAIEVCKGDGIPAIVFDEAIPDWAEIVI